MLSPENQEWGLKNTFVEPTLTTHTNQHTSNGSISLQVIQTHPHKLNKNTTTALQ